MKTQICLSALVGICLLGMGPSFAQEPVIKQARMRFDASNRMTVYTCPNDAPMRLADQHFQTGTCGNAMAYELWKRKRTEEVMSELNELTKSSGVVSGSPSKP